MVMAGVPSIRSMWNSWQVMPALSNASFRFFPVDMEANSTNQASPVLIERCNNFVPWGVFISSPCSMVKFFSFMER